MSRTPQLLAWLADHPDDRFARYALALERKKEGDLVAAEAELRTLLLRHPTSGPGWLQLGTLLADQGRDDDAIAAWRAGLAALAPHTDADAHKSRVELTAALAAVGE